MIEDIQNICRYCEESIKISPRSIPNDGEIEAFVHPAMTAVNNLSNELAGIFKNYHGKQFDFYGFVSDKDYSKIPWVALMPPGQTVKKGVTVGLIFDRQGRGFASGCMHSIRNNFGLNSTPVSQRLDLNIGYYDKVFHDPKAFFVDSIDENELLKYLRYSLDFALKHLGIFEHQGAFTTYQERADAILQKARKEIAESAQNENEHFLINRWIFARLHLDERATSSQVKQQLFRNNPFCHFCKEQFASIRGVHIHRLDTTMGYSIGNCVLAHKRCHEEEHRRIKENR